MLKSDAISYFGNQAKFAEEIGRAESTVSEWPDVLPLHVAVIVEKIAHGQVSVDWSKYPDAPRALRPQ
jgi:hypothetical protein